MREFVQTRKNRIIFKMNGQFQSGLPIFRINGGNTILIDFNEIRKITIPGMNGGTGTMSEKIYIDEQGKIIPTKNSSQLINRTSYV